MRLLWILALIAPWASAQDILCDDPIPDPVTPRQINECLDELPPVNQPPVLANPGSQTDTVNQPVSLQLIGSDPENDPLTWTYSGLPDGLSGDNTGLITGVPTNATTYPVATALADDGPNDPAVVEWVWTIEDDVPPPDPGTFAFTEIPVDECGVFRGAFGLSAGDFDGDGLGEVITGYHFTPDNPSCHWEFNGTKMALQQIYQIPGCANNLMSGDFNADGYSDVMCRDVNTTTQTTKGLHITYGSPAGIDPTQQQKQLCGAQNSSCYLVDGKLWDTTNDVWRDFDGSVIGTVPDDGLTIDGLTLNFAEHTTCEDFNGMHVAVADLDDDGDKDVVFWAHRGSWSNPPRAFCDAVSLENTGSGFVARDNAFIGDATFGAGSSNSGTVDNLHYGELHLADYNGDGYPDVMLSGRDYGDLYDVGLNDQTGRFVWTQGPWTGTERYTGSGSNQIRAGAAPFSMDADLCLDIAVVDGAQGALKPRVFRSQVCD